MKLQNDRNLVKLQKYIDYHFKNPSLLRQALTTPQLGNERNIPHYDILETIGDAVIKLIISVMLFKDLRVNKPGKLTIIKQSLESNQFFMKIASQMELWKYIYAATNQNLKNSAIISDVFEAICGAIYLDANEDLSPVKDKIFHRFLSDWDDLIIDYSISSKNELLEYLQEIHNITPIIEYQYIALGPQHDRRWKAKNPVIYDQTGNILIKLPENFESRECKTKKDAEKELSKNILDFLKKKEVIQ